VSWRNPRGRSEPNGSGDAIVRTQAALRIALANLEQKPKLWRRVLEGARAWAGVFIILALASVGYVYRAPVWDFAQIQIAKATGAEVDKITVEGAQYSSPDDLRTALQLAKGDSLVAYNTSSARERVEALPWVRLAAVEKRLPDVVLLTVYEHVPLARVEDDDGIWVVNKDGTKIEEDVQNRFASLPLLHGEGAPEAAATLFAMLTTYPNLMAQLDGATFVGKRRWNLAFKSGVMVMLPEDDASAALVLLGRLEATRHVLALPSGTIDLRLSERITLKLPADVGANPVTNGVEDKI